MRKICFLSFILFLLLGSCEEENDNDVKKKDELTIYDKNGFAVAYCNYSQEDETIIYLWNGKPTSYYSNENQELIYGFNGKFLGWRESGIYYDLEGRRIGFEKNSYNMVTSVEPVKYMKEILPIKSMKEMRPTHPIFSLDWSTTKLDSFLLKGIE